MKRAETQPVKTRRAGSQAWARYTVALGLALAMGSTPRAAGGPGASGSTGSSGTKGSAPARVDMVLAERLEHGNDDEMARVIITVKPGMKRELIQALKAQGAKVTADFRITEAFAADLPVGLVRALQVHGDVVAISTDAGVAANGLSSSVTGSPAGTPYTLRRTLGLETLNATAVTRTYQRGDANGAVVADGGVLGTAPTTGYGTAGIVGISTSNNGHVLLRFESLFGTGANQIPYGSKITSAKVSVYESGSGLTSATAALRRMLVTWPRRRPSTRCPPRDRVFSSTASRPARRPTPRPPTWRTA